MKWQLLQTFLLGGLVCALLPDLAAADYSMVTELDTVVVTANRVGTDLDKVGSAITIITEKAIKEKQKLYVLDYLRSVPGVNIAQTGNMGSATNVSIRGADRVLIMLDGIEMGDPSGTSGGYNLGNLTVDSIERIEVVRGPQSTLYGSEAMGGVINIITKKGSGAPKIAMSVEGGAYQTFTERLDLNGSNSLFNYAFGMFHIETEGWSASDKPGHNEKDGYENTSVSTRLGLTPTDNLSFDFIGKYIDTRNDLDGTRDDDPNYFYTNAQLFLRTQGSLSLFDNFWEQTLGVSYASLLRKYKNDPDPASATYLRSSYDGNTLKLDWQNNFYLHETNTLTFGVETEEERMNNKSKSKPNNPYTSNKADARTTSIYGQNQISLFNASWITTLGLRWDDHDEFGDKVTYRVTSVYNFAPMGTNIHGSYGTGFKSPSLYQLYNPTYGNADLKAETSKGWDIGIGQKLWGNRIEMDVTYFRNDFDDMIKYMNILGGHAGGTYVNYSKVTTQGVEASLGIRPIDDLLLSVAYTYTDTENKETGASLPREPYNRASFNANYQFLEYGNINFNLLYVGKRKDKDARSSGILNEYYLASMAASYKFADFMTVYGRIDNLFDEKYNEAFGYGTGGFGAYLGVKVEF